MAGKWKSRLTDSQITVIVLVSTKEIEMQQEDYNSVMKYPWEIIRKPHNEKLPDCPMRGDSSRSSGSLRI